LREASLSSQSGTTLEYLEKNMRNKIATSIVLGLSLSIATPSRAIDVTEFPVSSENISTVRFVLDAVQHPFAKSRESRLIAKDLESYCKTRSKGTSDRQISDRLIRETNGFSKQSRDRVLAYQVAIASVAQIGVCPQFR
jgi:hypothetical protein